MLRSIAYGLAGVTAAILGLELLLTALPTSTSTATGHYQDPAIVTYPPHHGFTVATGWALENVHRHRSNNMGFLAQRDFVREPGALGLIGDSYVDASMLDDTARLDARLETRLGGRHVQALGSAGSSLLDYAARIRFARQALDLREFVVVVELGDVMQSRCGSGNNQGPCLTPDTLQLSSSQTAPPGRVKTLLRHSALAQYFVTQLKVTASGLLGLFQTARPTETVSRPPAATRSPPGEVSPTFVPVVVDTFFALLPDVSPSRLLFVVDCNRTALEDGGDCATPTRSRFIELVRARGARVLDLDPPFSARWKRTGLSLAVSPRDGHWNASTVDFVAHRLGALLAAQQSALRPP